ncbi:Variant sh3 domain containing protein [Entamoeba marina]
MLPSHLGTGAQSIIDTLEEIRGGGENEWVVYHVNSKNGELVEDEAGTTIGDMVYSMEGDRLQFAYLRYSMDQTNKFLCVCWCGQASPDNLRTKFPNYSRDWEDFLKKNKHSVSVVIQARKEEDLEESVIVEKLNKSTGTFIRAKRTGEAKDNLSEKKNAFWQQQKQRDEVFDNERKQAEQQKEQDMMESKRREAERMQREAEQKKSNLLARNEAKVAQMRQEQEDRDAAEQQRWKQQEQKHQNFIQSRQQESQQQQAAPQVRGNVSAFANKFNSIPQEEEFVRPKPSGKKWTPPQTQPQQTYEQPAYEEPVQEEPAYEEPAYEEPAYEEPYQEPVQEEPAYEEPVQEEPAYEEPYQEPAYEEPVQEEPAYEEPAYEEPYQEPYQEPVQEEHYEEPSGTMYVADFDYDAAAEGDLTFREGDLLEVLSVDEDVGTVPLNYLVQQ